jgi:hypothetical protein
MFRQGVDLSGAAPAIQGAVHAIVLSPAEGDSARSVTCPYPRLLVTGVTVYGPQKGSWKVNVKEGQTLSKGEAVEARTTQDNARSGHVCVVTGVLV